MNLLGKRLLDSEFVKDPNLSDYIKIDGLVLGETPKFGYTYGVNTNVGNLLRANLNDNRIVVTLYQWSTGTYYNKSGFSLNTQGDYAKNTGFTTFIKISKVTPEFIGNFGGTVTPPVVKPPVVPIPPVVKPPAHSCPVHCATTTVPVPGTVSSSTSFVKFNKDANRFELNGAKFVPVGVNCFGLGLCQEYMNYFSNKQITEIFESVKKMSGTCIRSHTLGFSAASENSLLDYNLNFRERAWEPIDFSLSEARRTGIKVIPILCDPYEYYHASVSVFCTNGVSKEQFYTHPTPLANFKKFISEWLNHTNKYTKIQNKDCPDILCIELGNELGQDRASAGSKAIPTFDWLNNISNHIKSIAPNILTLCPTDETLGQSSEFDVKNLDIYSHHFYWNDFNRMSYGYTNSKNAKKPYIIGEYSSQFGQDWFNYIERLGVHGSFSWSLYPHESNGNRLIHGDGFDMWYDNYTPENSRQLLLHTNHFRRLQGKPQITELTF